jgi:hypothetical protein
MISGVPTWIGGTPPPANVGDLRDGGIVFWVDPEDNTHGLVCAIEDQSEGIRWNNGIDTTTGATGTSIGTGSSNTGLILTSQGGTAGSYTYAAGICADYTVDDGGVTYDDWFLPSKDELNEMRQNIGQGNTSGSGNVGGFSGSNYWSSTEIATNGAQEQYFSSGGSYGNSKNSPFSSVRAVRAF